MSEYKPAQPEFSGFVRRNHELRQLISTDNLARLADDTGAKYDHEQKVLELAFWDRQIVIQFPDIQIVDKKTQQILPEFSQAMILYYLHMADSAPLTGDWISFSELPDGKFYQRAFQGYTGQELTRQMGNQIEGFRKAAESLNARQGQIGSASYLFQVLPRVPILVVFWQGDEDFAASFQVLFDRNASHYLPTDAYAILGSTLSRKLIKGFQSIIGSHLNS